MRATMRMLVLVVLAASVTGLGGCLAAAGAGAAAGTYEYKNKEALKRLEQEYQAGKITKEEYLKRKQEIEKGSFVY